jgi:hypothetical protein
MRGWITLLPSRYKYNASAYVRAITTVTRCNLSNNDDTYDTGRSYITSLNILYIPSLRCCHKYSVPLETQNLNLYLVIRAASSPRSSL